MWNNQQELEFIEYFQNEPVLWDAKHRNYKDKSLNHDAWNRLSEIMEKQVPELKKKKDSLFASYRKYRKMVNDSSKSGAGENEVYKPIWFAYDALDYFLNQGLTPRTTINTTSNTEEPSTSRESTETTQTRNDTTPQTSRPRLIQSEVKEAGKYLKEALSTFQETIKKREATAPPDDCEIYGIMLAKKMRAFTEMERLEIMYDIDGLIINRRRLKQQHQLLSDTFVPSPIAMRRPSSSMSNYSEPLLSERVHRQNTPISYPIVPYPIAMSRPSSSMSSYSEPLLSERVHRQNTPISYPEPTQINILRRQRKRHLDSEQPIIHILEQNTQQLYTEPPVINFSEGQNTQTDEPNVRIPRNELLSNVISEAYNDA